MADEEETERVFMNWPKGLKQELQERVGKRHMTSFAIKAVRAALAAEPGGVTTTTTIVVNSEDPQALARQMARQLGSGPVDGPTDIGTPVGEHALLAVEVLHPDAENLPDLEAVKLHCLCGEAFSGSGKDGSAQMKARALFDEHDKDNPFRLTAKDVGAAAWFKDDPTFGTAGDSRLDELRALHGTKVTVISPDGTTRDAGPGVVRQTEVDLPHIQAPEIVENPDPDRPYSTQITEKILAGRTPEQEATVIDLQERFDLKRASEIEPPTADQITPVVPAGDLQFEEAAPTATNCDTCFAPLIDGTCWSCAI